MSAHNISRIQSQLTSRHKIHELTPHKVENTHNRYNLLWIGEVIVDLLVKDVENHVQEVPASEKNKDKMVISTLGAITATRNKVFLFFMDTTQLRLKELS